MTSRPCKADADVKRVWQLLLPDTPFPACGTQDNAEAGASAAPPEQDDAEAQPKLPRTPRDSA